MRVDRPDIGAWADGCGGIEFIQQLRDAPVPDIGAEQPHLEDPVDGVGQDAGIGDHHGLQHFAGIGFPAPGMDDRQSPPGFGATGEHADDVEERPLA